MDRFFFCHHKCASNWLWRYAQDLAERFSWRMEVRGGGPPETPRPDGAETLWFHWNSWPTDLERMGPDDRGIHLIRDPRDCLVSGYWSWRESHSRNNDLILRVREQLRHRDVEEGMLLMVDHVTSLDQLAGWPWPDPPGLLTLRYEDLLADTRGSWSRALDHLAIGLPAQDHDDHIERHSFTAITGRQPGDERPRHHFRKGIAGDWRNAFPPRIRARFEERHGAAMRRLGYDWS